MLRGIFVLGVVAFVFFTFLNSGFCEEQKAAEPNGMDLLSDLLKAKGVISPEEAAALKAKTTGAESAESIKALVDLLKSKGLVSDGEAERLNQTLAKKPTPEQAAAKAILVVPRDQEYVKKITDNVVTEVQKDIHEQVQTQVAEQGLLQSSIPQYLPDWVQKMQFSGDLRVRIEPFYFPRSNGLVLDPNNPPSLINTKFNQLTEYLRLRLKVEDQVNDKVTVGVRLATGDLTNPGGDNVILGNYFAKNGFALDQAYLRYHPCDDLNLWAGRMPNPWFYTDLIWSNDLNFEGVAASYRKHIAGDVTGYLTGGIFPLQENLSLTTHDKYLFGGQMVAEYKPERDYSFRLGVALYDYENITGLINPTDETIYDYTAPPFMQKGNTVVNIESQQPSTEYKYALAAHFRDLDILGAFDIARWDPIHVVISGDYIKNVAFDAQEVSALSGRPVQNMQDYAYRAGVLVGYPTPRKFLQWNVFAYYKYVGTDSVVDAFDDQDFHLGGTNAQGWILGMELGLMKNVWFTARWLTADEISPFQNSTGPFSVDVFQFDTNVSF
jgi:hypothetical protein